MAEKNSLADILERLRKEKRIKWIERDQWTQDAVAKRIGVTRQAYIAWEKGYSLPDIDHLKRIIEVFRSNEQDTTALYRAVAKPPPEIFHVPPFLSRFFTGREVYLKELRKLLQEEGVVAISGLGGIGKSQIALKYAYDSHPDVYRTVLWVNAADTAMLQADLASLAKTLELPEQYERNQEQRIDAVKSWLQTHYEVAVNYGQC